MQDVKPLETPAEPAPASLDNVLGEFVNSAPAPTPGVTTSVDVQPVTGQVATSTPVVSEKKDGRGRKKLPRDANGKIIRENVAPQPEAPRPKIQGLPPGVGQTVDHSTAAIDPAAEVAVMLVNTSGMVLGGADAAMTPEESILAKQGFVSYFKAKGVHNVPAWVVLAGALSPYYLRVITGTPAKSKIATFFGNTVSYIKGFFTGRKYARVNSGNDGQRKDNASEKNSPESKAK